jgi:UPF0716 protein FxsA
VARLVSLAFLLIPLIEIGYFIVIGQAIGLWPTLLGVLLTAIAGSILIRVQGRNLLSDMRTTMAAGQLPTRSVADALMIGAAGLLLLTPGYFTDLLGLVLLVPPVRGLIYRRLASRVRIVAMSGAPGARRPGGGPKDGPTLDLGDDDWRPR